MELLLEATAICRSGRYARTIGRLQLFEHKLVWEPRMGVFWPFSILAVPRTEIPVATITDLEAVRMGLGHGIRVRAGVREYLFAPAEGRIPRARPETAQKWLRAIQNQARDA